MTRAPKPSPDDLLTTEQVAAMLQLNPRTVANMRYGEKKGPPFVKLGAGPQATVRYRRGDVEAWVRGSDATGDYPYKRKAVRA